MQVGEVNHIVDHLTIEYKGVFSIKDMFRFFTKWFQESPYEKGGDYVSEMNSSKGKFLEYNYVPWKKQTDYVRHFMRLRLLIYDAKKVDIMVDGKKKKLDHAKIQIFIDGFVEYDYESRWSGSPFFLLLRTLYIKFFFKRFKNYMESMMVDDCHALYEMFERFFNMYKSYKPEKKMPHFY